MIEENSNSFIDVKQAQQDKKDVDKTKKSEENAIFTTLKGILIIVIFELTVCIAFSNGFFKIENTKNIDSTVFNNLKEKFSAFSFSMFVIITSVGTIMYSLLTKLPTSLISTPMLEFMSNTNEIAQFVYEECVDLNTEGHGELDIDSIVLTTQLITGICALLVSGLSFFVYSYGFGKFLQRVPSLASFVFLGNIGISFITCPLDIFNRIEEFYTGLKLCLLFILCYGVSMLMFYIDILTRFSYLVPLNLIFTTAAFYFIRISKILDDGKFLLLMNDKMTDINVFSHYLKTFKNATIASLKFKILFKIFPKLFSYTIFNMIHININVPSFKASCKVPVFLEHEYFVQGVANFIGSMFGCPLYFSFSFSSFIYSMGVRTAIPGVVAASIVFFASFFLDKISHNIPKAMGATVFGYFGFGMIYSFIIIPLTTQTRLDNIILITGLVFSVVISPVFGYVFTIAFCSMIVVLTYSSNLLHFRSNKQFFEQTAPLRLDSPGVCIDYPAAFSTIEMLQADLSSLTNNSVLDLSACPYVDKEANELISETISKIEGTVEIIGSPLNLNIQMLPSSVIFNSK